MERSIEMKKETIRNIVGVLFILYIAALFFILFLFGRRSGNQFGLEVFSKEHFDMINLIPFATISSFFEHLKDGTLSMNIVRMNMAANLIMFVPMGVALPVLFEKKFNKLWRVILFVAILVGVIEVLQFLTFAGSADIDDLILNTAGAVVGYVIIRILFVRMRTR